MIRRAQTYSGVSALYRFVGNPRATRNPDDGALRERLKELAQERRRFGYRRLRERLRREGHAVNRNGVQRLYRDELLTVRRPQAGDGHAEADRGGAAAARPALEPGLCLRPDDRRPALPHPRRVDNCTR